MDNDSRISAASCDADGERPSHYDRGPVLCADHDQGRLHSMRTTIALDARDGGVALARFEASDAGELGRLVAGEPADAELPRPSAPEQAAAWIVDARGAEAVGRALTFAVRDREGCLTGVVRLGSANTAGTLAALSYWIAAAHRGRGQGAAAARACVRIGFAQTAVVRVRALVRADNAASLAVLAKLGFAVVERGELSTPTGPRPLVALELARPSRAERAR